MSTTRIFGRSVRSNVDKLLEKVKTIENSISEFEFKEEDRFKFLERISDVNSYIIGIRRDLEKHEKLIANDERLLENISKVFSKSNLEEMVAIILDSVIELSGAGRGFLLLKNDDDNMEIKVAHNLKKEDINNPKFNISHRIIESVLEEKETICLANAADDVKFGEASSIVSLKLQSVLAVPIKSSEEVKGIVYVDNDRLSGLFDQEISKLVTSFANKIAIALENAEYVEQLEKTNTDLKFMLNKKYKFDSIIGQSPALMETLEVISQVADSNAPVLIQGESGVGKELLALATHHNSGRAKKSFIGMNCGALVENLLESELFGHVKGAFTGAVSDRKGKFEAADGGTLFLDEIGDMSKKLQMKLLRVLDNGEIQRVGSDNVSMVDVRIIAASNKDLKNLVAEGLFREDLYYRINVVKVKLPSLRERRDDIPALIQHFVTKFSEELNKEIKDIDHEVEKILLNYDYPGNIRELENIIKHAVILTKKNTIRVSSLPKEIRDKSLGSDLRTDFLHNREELKEAKRKVGLELERKFILRALKNADGNITQAAKETDFNRSYFQQLVSKHRIDTDNIPL